MKNQSLSRKFTQNGIVRICLFIGFSCTLGYFSYKIGQGSVSTDSTISPPNVISHPQQAQKESQKLDRRGGSQHATQEKPIDKFILTRNKVAIPREFISKISISPLNDDFSLSTEFCALVGLSEEDQQKASEIVSDTSAKLEELELRNLRIIEQTASGVTMEILPSEEAAPIYEKMRSELSKIISEPFMELLQPPRGNSGPYGLIAGRGQFRKILKVTKNSSGSDYSLSEDIYIPAAPDSGAEWVNVGSRSYRSFNDVPQAYKHLIEKPSQ